MLTDDDTWCEALTAHLPPIPGLAEALRVHRQSNARNDQANAALASAQAALALLLESDGPHSQLVRTAALDVVSAQTVRDALPPAVPVDPSYAVTLVEQIAAWFAQHPAVLGAPPLCLAEARHHHEMHRNDPHYPRGTDREVQAMDLFGSIALRHYEVGRQVALLTSPVEPARMGDRASVFLQFVDEWLQHAELILTTRALVDQVDAERRASGTMHRCPAWNGATVGPLMAVDAFVDGKPWTEERAMRDGLPTSPELVTA